MTRLLAALVLLASPAAAGNAANYNYALHCLGCHTHEGVSPELGHIPPLKDQVGHFARTDEGRRYLANVPGIVNSGLPDREIAALLNWTIEIFGGSSVPDGFRPFTGEEVTELRARRPDDAMLLRSEVRAALAAMGYAVGAYP